MQSTSANPRVQSGHIINRRCTLGHQTYRGLEAEGGRGIVVGVAHGRGAGNTSAGGGDHLDLAGASAHAEAGHASVGLTGKTDISVADVRRVRQQTSRYGTMRT